MSTCLEFFFGPSCVLTGPGVKCSKSVCRSCLGMVHQADDSLPEDTEVKDNSNAVCAYEQARETDPECWFDPAVEAAATVPVASGGEDSYVEVESRDDGALRECARVCAFVVLGVFAKFTCDCRSTAVD